MEVTEPEPVEGPVTPVPFGSEEITVVPPDNTLIREDGDPVVYVSKRSGAEFRKLLHPDDQERLSSQVRRLAAAGAREREEEALNLCARAFSYLVASQAGATAAAA